MIPIFRALWQTSNTVVVRKPGQRFLSGPQPIAPFAKEHWEFAWLSDAAYLQTAAGQKHIEKKIKKAVADVGAVAPDPLPPLAAAGWKRWENFPGEELLKKIKDSHLRVQVWERD